ncbi:MFS transporter [Motilibacter peucedani]|uniref:MFS transporter n=1 Tax=Motilibacter peucedani TaxID=598650 RepID=UPI000EAFA062|nr:MFS transporter [Motilibacter peucedani]
MSLALLGPYGEVLRVPGAARFSAAAFFARMPMSMEGLGVVFLVQSTTGSYASAGVVTGALGVSTAVGAPVTARVSDRRGQGFVLRRVPLVRVLSYLLLVLCARAHAPLAVLVALACTAGLATAQPGSLVRARWSHVLRERPALVHTAFSLESALDELIFVVGPVAVTLVATQVSPTAGLLLPAAGLLTGALLLAGQRGTEPPPAPVGGEHHVAGTVIGLPPIALLALVYVFLGGTFGSVEVSVVAFTEEHGAAGAAGGVLAAFAVSSMVAGLVWGTLHLTGTLSTRYLVLSAAFGLSTLTFPFAGSDWALAGLLCLSGFAISPMIVSGLGLADELAPAGRRTEAITWTTTGLTIGASAGGALAGHVIDASSGARALWVAAACGVLGGGLSLCGGPLLHRAERASTARASSASDVRPA